jgi:DNA-binding transcriptional ArsR family regulator
MRVCSYHHVDEVKGFLLSGPNDPTTATMTAMNDLLRGELDELTSRMCKALNDPKRLMLLLALGEEPKSVSDLCQELDLPQSNVSQHLAVLRERGIVEANRQGSFVLYHLRYPQLLDAIGILRDVMGQELERQAGLPSRGAASRGR